MACLAPFPCDRAQPSPQFDRAAVLGRGQTPLPEFGQGVVDGQPAKGERSGVRTDPTGMLTGRLRGQSRRLRRSRQQFEGRHVGLARRVSGTRVRRCLGRRGMRRRIPPAAARSLGSPARRRRRRRDRSCAGASAPRRRPRRSPARWARDQGRRPGPQMGHGAAPKSGPRTTVMSNPGVAATRACLATRRSPRPVRRRSTLRATPGSSRSARRPQLSGPSTPRTAVSTGAPITSGEWQGDDEQGRRSRRRAAPTQAWRPAGPVPASRRPARRARPMLSNPAVTKVMRRRERIAEDHGIGRRASQREHEPDRRHEDESRADRDLGDPFVVQLRQMGAPAQRPRGPRSRPAGCVLEEGVRLIESRAWHRGRVG